MKAHLAPFLIAWLGLFACFPSAASSENAAPSAKATIVPEEDKEIVLHNPDMGWVIYENYPIDDRSGGSSTLVTCPDDRFDGVDYVAVMFSWADIEKREGEYDFSKIDFACDYWRRRGKGIHLRVSTESLLWWSHANPPAGMGIPDYVLQRIPAEKKQRRETDGQFYWVVDAREPFYLERLRKFLDALHAHYRGEREAALTDLRGFGLWGEWHTGYRYATVEDRHAALSKILDVWSEALPDHHLALSFSHDPDGPKEYYAGPYNRHDEAFTKNYDAFARFSAFDHALTKPNVTLRRDGAGGAVFSNQRKLCEHAFTELRRAPMMSEFLGGYGSMRSAGPKWIRFMIDDALSLHPNYVNVLGWQCGDARDFLRDRPDLFAHGLRTMGYRLVPLEIRYPPKIEAGAPITLEMEWANRGVGRALRDYLLKVRLVDEKGGAVASSDAGPLPTSEWLKGKTYRVAKQVSLGQPPAGKFTLEFALWDAKTNRAIALPLVKVRGDGFAAVGPVEATPRAK